MSGEWGFSKPRVDFVDTLYILATMKAEYFYDQLRDCIENILSWN
jgi:hypothetical protein